VPKAIGFLSHLDDNLYLFRLPIMQALVAKGHKVYAIAPRGKRWQMWERHGIVPVDYRIDRGSLNPLREIQAIQAIYQTLLPLNLDILHTFTAKPNIYGTLAGRRAGIPVIYNLVEGLGSFYVEDSGKNLLMRRVIERLYRYTFSQSDLTVFVNRDDPAYMIKRNIIDPSKVRVIRSVGVDTSFFDSAKVEAGALNALRKHYASDGKPIVLMVARAIWHKGVREYYEAAERLRDEARFLLVGGTDPGNPSCADEDFLRRGAVTWVGEQDDMRLWTALADLYVLPSYREGVPRTLLEAASMGKPLVATDVVGCREVVDPGRNGLLVPPRHAGALADAIEALLKDPECRKRMGEESRKLACEAFDVARVVEQYLPLYEEG
jgi:N,N'-diacetylbacillosaminyl-diphospho-undecaprenol alpha-1,3-N-acetylgalactosaminyltransferase